MGKVLFGIIAAVASLMMVESLTCNQCPFGLVGLCVLPQQQSCSFNTSVCYTAKATFSVLPAFLGFNTQGCLDNSTSCNGTVTSSFLSAVNYTVNTSCCATDKCNPLQSGAATSSITISATLGAALLASVMGSVL